MSQNYDQMVEAISACREDVEKAEAGNKAATSRGRSSMQGSKACAQEPRQALLQPLEMVDTTLWPSEAQLARLAAMPFSLSEQGTTAGFDFRLFMQAPTTAPMLTPSVTPTVRSMLQPSYLPTSTPSSQQAST